MTKNSIQTYKFKHEDNQYYCQCLSGETEMLLRQILSNKLGKPIEEIKKGIYIKTDSHQLQNVLEISKEININKLTAYQISKLTDKFTLEQISREISSTFSIPLRVVKSNPYYTLNQFLGYHNDKILIRTFKINKVRKYFLDGTFKITSHLESRIEEITEDIRQLTSQDYSIIVKYWNSRANLVKHTSIYEKARAKHNFEIEEMDKEESEKHNLIMKEYPGKIKTYSNQMSFLETRLCNTAHQVYTAPYLDTPKHEDVLLAFDKVYTMIGSKVRKLGYSDLPYKHCPDFTMKEYLDSHICSRLNDYKRIEEVKEHQVITNN